MRITMFDKKCLHGFRYRPLNVEISEPFSEADPAAGQYAGFASHRTDPNPLKTPECRVILRLTPAKGNGAVNGAAVVAEQEPVNMRVSFAIRAMPLYKIKAFFAFEGASPLIHFIVLPRR